MNENYFNYLIENYINSEENNRPFPKPKKPFKCQTCRKKLSSKQALKEHLYIHTNEKLYECKEPGCSKKFRQGSQFSLHKKLHSSIKEFQSISLSVIQKKVEQNEKRTVDEDMKVKLPALIGPQPYHVLPNIFIQNIK